MTPIYLVFFSLFNSGISPEASRDEMYVQMLNHADAEYHRIKSFVASGLYKRRAVDRNAKITSDVEAKVEIKYRKPLYILTLAYTKSNDATKKRVIIADKDCFLVSVFADRFLPKGEQGFIFARDSLDLSTPDLADFRFDVANLNRQILNIGPVVKRYGDKLQFKRFEGDEIVGTYSIASTIIQFRFRQTNGYNVHELKAFRDDSGFQKDSAASTFTAEYSIDEGHRYISRISTVLRGVGGSLREENELILNSFHGSEDINYVPFHEIALRNLGLNSNTRILDQRPGVPASEIKFSSLDNAIDPGSDHGVLQQLQAKSQGLRTSAWSLNAILRWIFYLGLGLAIFGGAFLFSRRRNNESSQSQQP